MNCKSYSEQNITMGAIGHILNNRNKTKSAKSHIKDPNMLFLEDQSAKAWAAQIRYTRPNPLCGFKKSI